MLRPLYEILTTEDLAALTAAGTLTTEEVQNLKDQQEQAQIDLDWHKLVQQRCRALLAEKNDNISQARKLRRQVVAHGGISKSDYEDIPAKYKRKAGLSLDQIASELDYADDTALALDIDSAENILKQLPIVNSKRVQYYRIKDMIADAEESLLEEHGRIWQDDQNDDCPF